jgi:carbamoyl-phosphate synthase large subunit
VSTDYDTSDKLYFEPVTAEHVRNIVHREQPRGSVLQFGGQTPLKLSHRVGTVLGTQPDAIDVCEDRKRFNALLTRLGVRQPEGEMVKDREGSFAAVARLGFPVLVRPSYVLGGRAMKICYDRNDFTAAVDEVMAAERLAGSRLSRIRLTGIPRAGCAGPSRNGPDRSDHDGVSRPRRRPRRASPRR